MGGKRRQGVGKKLGPVITVRGTARGTQIGLGAGLSKFGVCCWGGEGGVTPGSPGVGVGKAGGQQGETSGMGSGTRLLHWSVNLGRSVNSKVWGRLGQRGRWGTTWVGVSLGSVATCVSPSHQ